MSTQLAWVGIVSDFVLPSVAILVPTGVALFLAHGERVRGERARRQEAADSESAQQEERNRRELDRRRDDEQRQRDRAEVAEQRAIERRTAAIDAVVAALEVGPPGSADLAEDTAASVARRLRVAAGRLRVALGGAEPELPDWLDAEAQKLGRIHSAIGLQRGQPGRFDPMHTRGLVLAWWETLNATFLRLVEYETQGGGAVLLDPWLAEVRAFLADPAGDSLGKGPPART